MSSSQEVWDVSLHGGRSHDEHRIQGLNFNFGHDSGEWEKQKQLCYSKLGSHVKANGEVLSPAAFADGAPATYDYQGRILVEVTSEYDNVPTGTVRKL